MSRKAFHVGIDLDIHAVSCPGVWLCPKGDAMLRICMLGASAHTKRVEPIFPLLFHESFHFRKTLTGVTSLAGLQDEMTRRSVLIQLIQWEVHGCRCVILASFRCSVSELLYPQPAAKNLLAGVDIDLLMETTPCFPGIIAPKVEVSTKVVIEEMVKYPNHSQDSHCVNPKTLASKRPGNCKEQKNSVQNKNMVRPKIRQKPVCHTRPNVRCYYCKQRVERARKNQCRDTMEGKCASSPLPLRSAGEDTIYTPYCNKCGDIVEENEVKQGKIIMKESAQNARKWETTCPCAEPQHSKSACNCILCKKYDNLFKNSTLSSVGSFSKPNKLIDDQSPRSVTKDQICTCLGTKVGENERLRAGVLQGENCQGGIIPFAFPGLLDCLRDPQSDLVLGRKGPSKNEDYRKMLEADLDTHYKKLYERVSHRSNRRES